MTTFSIADKGDDWVWFCRHCKEGGHAYEFAERQGSIPPEHISTTPKKKLEINWFEIEPTAIYDYTDADGKLLFQVLRKEYWNDGNARQRHLSNGDPMAMVAGSGAYLRKSGLFRQEISTLLLRHFFTSICGGLALRFP